MFSILLAYGLVRTMHREGECCNSCIVEIDVAAYTTRRMAVSTCFQQILHSSICDELSSKMLPIGGFQKQEERRSRAGIVTKCLTRKKTNARDKQR